MEDLFKQLDLAIYALSPVHWWQHPFLQLFTTVLVCGSIFLIILIARKKKRQHQEPELQHLLATLYQSARLWQQGLMSQREVLLVITALVRNYTYLIVHDTAVLTLTDEQWLVYSASNAHFQAVEAEAVQLVGLLVHYKFSNKSLTTDQIKLLFELVYQIIAKTSSGSIALTSGLFDKSVQDCKT